MSRWQTAYQEYVELRMQLPSGERRHELELAVAKGVDGLLSPLVGSVPPAPGEAPYPASLKGRLSEIHRTVWEARGVGSPGDDPYEAAFVIIRDSTWNPQLAPSDPQTLYRGQADHRWLTLPSLHRKHTSSDDDPNIQAMVARRLAELRSFSTALADDPLLGKHLKNEQRTAVAQHYGVRTALIDFTTDPFVALFFAASDKPRHRGHLGVVCGYSEVEWSNLFQEAKVVVGDFHTIDVPGVPRLERQHGRFLIGSHPDIIVQFAPKTVSFRQTGIGFEDASRGISKKRLYPSTDEDPYARFYDRWKERHADSDADLDISHSDIQRAALLADRPWFSTEEFVAIAAHLLAGHSIDPARQLVVHWLCRLWSTARRLRYTENRPRMDERVNVFTFVFGLEIILSIPERAVGRGIAEVLVGWDVATPLAPALAILRQEPDWPVGWVA